MTDKPVRLATYARVSTQEQAVEGTSLEYQSDQLESYCKFQGWEIAQSYVDPGHSGKDDNRPGLKRLLADAKIGLFNKVVVYKMDRLARNLRLLLEIEEKLKEYDISFHSISETFDTSTANGRHFLQMLGMVSEWERETIIERTKAGRLQRYREGCWAGGKTPYGYIYNRESKKLVINKKEARIVCRIFEQYNSSKSLSSIANTLNEEQIPARWNKGKGWRANAVRHIIINPMYKGMQVLNRHQHISDIARVDMSKAIVVNVPKIIPEEDWQLAQEHLIANKKVRPVRKNKWLLQGLVTCGLCGMSFKAEPQPGRRYYSCRGRLKQYHVDGSPRCTSPRFKADWLEEQVWQKIKAIINDPNKLKPMIEKTIESLKSREEELLSRIQPVNEKLAEISEQKAKLADEWIISNMMPERFQELKRGLDREEARLKSIRTVNDPAQVQELENTKDWLRIWQRQLESMAWNTETEDYQMIRLVNEPHKTALKIIDIEDENTSKSSHFPTKRRKVLDRLQVQVVVFHDRIDIKSVFNIEPIHNQKCTSPYRRGSGSIFRRGA